MATQKEAPAKVTAKEAPKKEAPSTAVPEMTPDQAMVYAALNAGNS